MRKPRKASRLESLKIHTRNVRLAKDYSLEELSTRSGVAISHIYNIELGNCIPSITVLCKLAKALKVPCSELFSY